MVVDGRWAIGIAGKDARERGGGGRGVARSQVLVGTFSVYFC